MLADLNLMIRGAVIGISALMFILLFLSPASRRKSLSIGAIAITLAAHMAEGQDTGDVWSDQSKALALAIGNFIPMAMTFFVLDIFLEREDRRCAGGYFLAMSVVVTMVCFTHMAETPLHVGLNLLLFCGLFYLVLSSRQGDLVERRRSFRVVFVLLMVSFSAIKLILDQLISPQLQPAWVSTAYAASCLGFVVVFAHWALRPGADTWVADDVQQDRKPNDPAVVDKHVLQLIAIAMRDELWRREGLTIGAMAEEIGTPEHRLRKAINRDLGFRNFSTFVNRYRIDAAKAALSAPENAQKTILEIAYDVGFASLGPFNKAFRTMTGTSPRDYRRAVSSHSSITA